MRPRPVDPSLGHVFHVAQAIEAGESAERLRRSDLHAPFRGVRTIGTMPPWQAYRPLLRVGERFSHVTAAELFGAPLPAEHQAQLHTSTPLSMSRAKGRGVRGHRSRHTRVAFRSDVPVSTPADLFLECATLLDTDALVALGDYLILDPRQLDPADFRPYISHAALLSAVRQSTGRAVVRAREAARLVRPGVESPMETRLRLRLIRAGLPDPVCGYALRSPRGAHIGFFDLAWPEQRVIAEYDGDQHRTSTRQYDRDISRFDRAAEAGWRVIRVRARGLSEAPARVARALGR